MRKANISLLTWCSTAMQHIKLQLQMQLLTYLVLWRHLMSLVNLALVLHQCTQFAFIATGALHIHLETTAVAVAKQM